MTLTLTLSDELEMRLTQAATLQGMPVDQYALHLLEQILLPKDRSQALVASGVRVIMPEIADYELRRELLRAKKRKGIEKLDALERVLEYLPLTTPAMRQAALFWAQARQQGQPTAGDKTIDADMILTVQAATLGVSDVVIATTNVGHLSRFAPAELWHNVKIE